MELRHWIYFGFGTLATIPFGMRTLIQWFLSEYHKKSYVPAIFWLLSIIGNILMLVHYLIQVQFHLYFIRIFPIYFSFRQVALMKGTATPFSWSKLIKWIAFLCVSLVALFMLRVYIEFNSFLWILNPQMPWETVVRDVSSLWHLFGFFGAFLFTGRLWVQWWQSEKTQESVLPPSFWWMSIIGGLSTCCYALFIQDLITALGCVMGTIPYARNLMLIRKARAKPEEV